MSTSLPHWLLLGAGNMGTLAASYLIQAGHRVTVLRPASEPPLLRQLCFSDGRQRPLTLPVTTVHALRSAPSHLLVACKTPYTEAALAPLQPMLKDTQLVVRLQNGLGALDGLLPAGPTLIETVTTSAVKGQAPRHDIVAENDTWWGGQPRAPAWFADLQPHWPNLYWQADLRHRQWQKLVVNAVINPLTALHDVDNGVLLTELSLRRQAEQLCREADAVLQRLDPAWPAHSLDNVLAVARATAANTSSMRADRQRGNRTEVDAINGYLLTRARELGMTLPAHAQIVAALS
ncbi:MAG: 2-dehydropantoate 2-reductase [Alcanivorax sp.]|nr:2-dehydropantoate 2-reductase [Alcanivorax sp.]